MQSGLTYYKLDTNLYGGDTTKGCSLTGGEIDNNFNFLRSMDIVGGYYDETGLHLKNVGDDSIDIPFDGLAFSGTSFDFSGSSYDAENGILDLYVNGEYFPISGFSVCDCENLWNAVSAFTDTFECYTGETQEQIENIFKSLERYESSLSAITSGETVSTKDILAHIVTIDTQLAENKGNISKNTDDITGINNTLTDHAQSIKSLQDNKQDISNIKTSVEHVSGELNEEISRATAVEEKIVTDLQTQTDRISEIYGNVDNILGAAKDTIDHYKVTGITLDNTDKLNLYFGNSIDESEGHHLEVSLAKYNVKGDNETISRKDDENGKGTLSVIFGENGAVSYKEFKQHKIAYNELSAKYESLKSELDALKNETICYAACFAEGHYETDRLFQHKYKVDVFNNAFIFEIIKDGRKNMIAIPSTKKIKSISAGISLTDIDPISQFSNNLPEFTSEETTKTAIDGHQYDIFSFSEDGTDTYGNIYKIELEDKQ